ncbi:MAG: hypothetical protein AAF329_21595, partial [Cyanobacteria bacterium P01_A01_bin.17]
SSDIERFSIDEASPFRISTGNVYGKDGNEFTLFNGSKVSFDNYSLSIGALNDVYGIQAAEIHPGAAAIYQTSKNLVADLLTGGISNVGQTDHLLNLTTVSLGSGNDLIIGDGQSTVKNAGGGFNTYQVEKEQGALDVINIDDMINANIHEIIGSDQDDVFYVQTQDAGLELTFGDGYSGNSRLKYLVLKS